MGRFLWGLIIFGVLLFGIIGGMILFSNSQTNSFDAQAMTKTYDKQNQEITITDKSNPTETVSKVKLDTPLINYVIRGKDRKVAEFTIETYKDYTNAFDNMEFYNVKAGNQKIQRTFTYKYLAITGTKEVIDYKKICEEIIPKNESKLYQNCSYEKIGTHKENISEWRTFNEKAILPSGKITIGIFTDVLPNERVEWVPTLFGVKINEWAVWVDSFDIGLLHWWEPNSTYNKMVDLVGVNNGTLNGAYIVSSAPDGREAVEFNGTSYVDVGIMDFPNGTGSFTILIGINNSGVNHYGTPISNGDADSAVLGKFGIWMATSGNDDALFPINKNTDLYMAEGEGAPMNQFYNLVWMRNTSGEYIYRSGVPAIGLQTQLVPSTRSITSGTNIYFGKQVSGNSMFFSGQIYKVAMWNRSLNASDILYLNDTYFVPPLPPDAEYPQFTNYWDNNGTQYDGGIGYFNVTVTSTTGNVILTYNNTNYTASNNSGNPTTFNVTLVGMTNGTYPYNWTSYGNGSLNKYNISEIRSYTILENAIPVVKLITPLNNTNFSTSISFNCTGEISPIKKINNVSLWINGARTINENDGINNYTELITTLGLADGVYNWTCSADDNSTTTLTSWASGNRTFTIDTTSPTLTDALNITNLTTFVFPVSSTWNYTASDVHIQNCYYNTSDNSLPTIITPCGSTEATVWATNGSKTIWYYANDTFGHTSYKTINLTVNYFVVNQSGVPITSEGTLVSFSLLINSTEDIGNAYAELWYNNTNLGTTTETFITQKLVNFTKTFIMPMGWGNSTGSILEWNWTYNTTYLTTRNTLTQNQTVYGMSIGDCVISGFGKIILNMSLRDEQTLELLDISGTNTTTIEINLDITSKINSSMIWSFSKKWLDNQSVAICVPNEVLNYSSYKIHFITGYSGTNHVQEFYYMDNGTLNNSDWFNSYTNNTINLFDLLTADSTTFLFTFTDKDGLEVPNSIVHTFRDYIGEGIFREVERSKQDDNGQTHVHLVEEDVIYYFMVTENGNIIYTSSNYNAKCLSSPCEITLSASPSELNWSSYENEGEQYSVTTDKTTRIATTTFNLADISIVNVSLYRLYNGELVLINKSGVIASSGSIPLHIPVSYNNATFFVSIYRNGVFVKSIWVSLVESGIDYFGTGGAILGGLMLLAILLMAVTEGTGFIIFLILGIIAIVIMGLVDLGWMAIISIICAGGIIIFKLTSRRNKSG